MIPSDIGQNIRRARKARGITQEQLAALLYVSRQTVSSWENARTQPDYETLQKLSELLGVSMSDLFGAADQPAPQEPIAAEPLPKEVPPAPPADTPQSSFPPVLPEVVQPKEEPATESRTKALYLAVAACALACALLAAWFFARQTAYSPEQFMKTAVPAEGQAYVTLYVKDSRVNLISGKDYPTWSYGLYLREDHGVGFQIETLRLVYFLADGQTVEVGYSASDIARMKQTSHLNGYGLMALFPGYTPSEQNPAHPVGVGALLEGRDDGMHAQAYTLYIPLDLYP